MPQTSFAPSKFREFRMAVSQMMNRQAMNETYALGRGTPQLWGTPFAYPGHPSFPGEENVTRIAESPSSNPEAARAVLEEAGWGWDGDGNLHYPPDADLSPRWPEGSQPAEHEDQFPCVSEMDASGLR